MQFQQMINNINILDILNSENSLLEALTGAKFSEGAINYINSKINYLLKELGPYELIGEDLDYSSIVFENLLRSQYNRLMTRSYFIKLITSPVFNNIETVDAVNSTAINSTGYSGFNIENQEGQYAKSSGDSTVYGNNRLQAIEYLRTYVDNWIDEFKALIRFNLCRVIY